MPDLRSFRGTRRHFKTLRKTIGLARLLWPRARSYKSLLAGGAALGAVAVAFRIALPWPLKWIVDSLSGVGLESLGWLTEQRHFGVAALGAVYIVIAIGAALSEYGQRLVLAGLGNRVVHHFRTELYRHILQLQLAFHERRETGELLTRVVYDTARLRQGVNGILTRIFQNLFLLVSTIAVLLWIDVGLAMVVGLSGVMTLGFMGGGTRRIRRAARESRRREGKVASVVAEALLGIRELQTFRPGDNDDKRFGRQHSKSLRQEQKVRRLAAGLLLRVEVVLAITVATILWLGTMAVQSGRLTPGDLVLFVSYAVALYRPYRQFARQAGRVGRTFACAERLTNIMTQEPTVADLPGAVPASQLRGDIAFRDVAVRRPRPGRKKRRWVLQGTSFHVRAGERVAIIGPNGAGKSTLLRLVLRLADPHDGRVYLDGRDLREYTLESVRRQISVVFQDSVFFGLTVRENIALGRPEATFEQIRDAARRAQAAELIKRLKHGYDTSVRKSGRLFSAGERQRLALARALLHDGRIWLLDEPTTSLDAETARDLVALILAATEGRTVLWVTHDPTIVSCLDRVLVLGAGSVRFSGSVEEYAAWRDRAEGESRVPNAS